MGIFKSIKQFLSRVNKKLWSWVDKKPFTSFLVLLGVLLVLVIIGNVLRKPKLVVQTAEQPPKQVQVHNFSETPTITLSAEVEKTGVITLYAQTAGIVQKINAVEGAHVSVGQTLVNLSTTYRGGNAASLSRQIAQKQATFSKETFDTQMQNIARLREVANKVDTQASELRDITRRSLDDTRAQISLNEDIVNTLSNNIAVLTATNVGGANDSLILSAKQGKAGALAALTNLRSGLRQAEYSSTDDKTPAQLGRTNRDVTLAQLDIQEKSVTLSRDIADLSLKLARINESLMYPTTPCAGVVERVYVKMGQAVNPGTPLMVVRADKRSSTVVARVPQELAQQISSLEPSQLQLNGKSIPVTVRYISKEPTEGSLHTVIYTVPAQYADAVANKETVQIVAPSIRSTNAQTGMTIPLDAVYQTPQQSYVFVVNDQNSEKPTAMVKEVQLGQISGSYVTVKQGLTTKDKVITTRGVTDGERVDVRNE